MSNNLILIICFQAVVLDQIHTSFHVSCTPDGESVILLVYVVIEIICTVLKDIFDCILNQANFIQ